MYMADIRPVTIPNIKYIGKVSNFLSNNIPKRRNPIKGMVMTRPIFNPKKIILFLTMFFHLNCYYIKYCN